MKSATKTVNFLLLLFAVILGIVIVVNLFYPSMFPQLEGFKEGNTGSRPTTSQQVCDKKTCSKSFSAIDKWFDGKKISDTKDFFNASTGSLLTKPKYPFTIDSKDNCSSYIQCKANSLVKSSSSSDSSSSSSDSSSSSSDSSKSGSSSSAKDALIQAQKAITDALGKV
jgi:hypothetical protein